jgi:hypothetical protein
MYMLLLQVYASVRQSAIQVQSTVASCGMGIEANPTKAFGFGNERESLPLISNLRKSV